MKRIFITGIAGFIGFHLAMALKRRGDHVIGCDNFNAYYDPSLKRKRAELLTDAGVNVVDCDIMDKERIASVLRTEKITHFVHLAAQAGVRYAMTHPETYVHSNLCGFVNVLELLRQYPIPCIYASSSSVYGLNAKIPFTESDMTDHPASFYGATKKSNEMIAHSYHHLYHIPMTALRFFTVYGPWGRPDMAYFSFTKAICDETPIPLFGDGSMQRDFTYIDDIVSGIVSAIDLGANFEIFNLGNNRPHSVLEMIALLEKFLGKKAIIAEKAIPPGEVQKTYASIEKSERVLGFKPVTSLEKGLERFIDWYQKEHASLL